MAERIDCKWCKQPSCDGCNVLTLVKMLESGKFDCLMDETRTIRENADVQEIRHGEWSVAIGYDPARRVKCSECERMNYEPSNYCPNCGADMRGDA